MSALKSTLQQDLTRAIKTRDEVTTATVRMALAAITKAEVAGEQQVALTDDEIVRVLATEVKRRREAAEAFERGNRPDRAERERQEAEVLERYLPAALSDDALGALVREELARVDASMPEGKRMGAVITAVRERAGAGADGARIAAAVKAALAQSP